MIILFRFRLVTLGSGLDLVGSIREKWAALLRQTLGHPNGLILSRFMHIVVTLDFIAFCLF